MDYIIQEIQTFQRITTGKQKEYYTELLRNIKPVKVVPLKDVFTEEEIRRIKQIDIQQNECYRNSYLLTALFPGRVMYVEGKVLPENLITIDHAFNRVGDVYVDITFELVLKLDVTRQQYASIAEYDLHTLSRITSATGYWGDCYKYEWIRKYKSNGKH